MISGAHLVIAAHADGYSPGIRDYPRPSAVVRLETKDTRQHVEPRFEFAGYQIERVLGGGGTGTVYLACDPDLPRSEALKVLNAELSSDQDFRAWFIREAEVAPALDHPNIVSIHQRGEFDGQLWIATQFIDGADG